MEKVTPSWLNNEFLIHVLQSIEGKEKKIEVTNFCCKPAIPSGNNHLSILWRVTVDYKLDHLGCIKSSALIVKTPLDSCDLRTFIEENKGYRNEVQTYTNILPKMYELHSFRISANSFPCPLEDFLVMEDLKESDFKMADRLKQLDVPHCQRFFTSLAIFHAVSVAAVKKYPELVEAMGKHLFFHHYSEEDKIQKRTSSNGLVKALIKTLEKLEGCGRYARMIHERVDTYWDKMAALVVPGKGLNVINHGDPWTTNMMFKYNDVGEIIDIKLVDFQWIQYCSFCLDINYFWWTSANEEVREHHREEMFELYRHTLNNGLRELNCSSHILNKETFDSEMQSKAFLSIYVLAHILPIAMSDPDDPDWQLDSFSPDDYASDSNDSPQWRPFNSKYLKMVLPKMMQQVERFGAFD